MGMSNECYEQLLSLYEARIDALERELIKVQTMSGYVYVTTNFKNNE